jgi:hypothetical protein
MMRPDRAGRSGWFAIVTKGERGHMPFLRWCGLSARAAIMPVDPESQGTWIGVNDVGLIATLLNVNIHTAQSPESIAPTDGHRVQSRGTIIPRLLACDEVDAAVESVRTLDPFDFSPFRLVLLDGRRIAEMRSDGQAITINTSLFEGQSLFFTSSGLGDELVDAPRRKLFEEIFANEGNLLELQDRFHAHCWPETPHISVFMSRPDAHTVSRSIVEVDEQAVRMAYSDTTSGTPAAYPPVSLSRRMILA